jgi:hypothetical protein
MPRYNVIFEANEEIYGVVLKVNDWVHYSCVLKVRDGRKQPVSLQMNLEP